MVGPASATDDAVATFDLTTGKLIQDTVVTIAQTTGNMAGVGTLGVGAITTTAVLDMGSNLINNVTDPASSQDAATKAYVDQSVSFVSTYYCNNTASDIGGIYYKMLEASTGEAESSFTTAGLTSGAGQALTNFATDANLPGVNILKAGVYSGHIHVERTAGTRSVLVYFEIYTRTSGGTETLRATSEDSATITSKADVTIHATIASDIVINTTDRIIIKWLADIGASGSNATVVLYVEGDDASRLDIPTTTEVLNSVFVRQDGTKALTANWDVGAFTITGTQFISDIAGGTPPFVVTSSTEVANLKAATATTAANLSGTPDLPNGTTATTQSPSDNTTKLATTAYADAAGGGIGGSTGGTDNAILLADGTGGSTLQNSGIEISDSDAITGALLLATEGSNSLISVSSTSAQSTSSGGLLRLVSLPGAAILSGNRLGNIQFAGDRNGGTGIATSIEVFTAENWSSSNLGTTLKLSTIPNTTTSPVVGLEIAQDGVVTIPASLVVTNGATIDADGIDLVSGNDYEIDGTAVLNATTLGGAVLASSLTSVGTMTSGSLGTGFTDVAVAQGGTGTSSLTDNGVMLGSGTGAVTVTAVGTTGQVLTGNTGADPTWENAAGGGANVTLSNLTAGSVAINTTLASDTDNTDDLGTAPIGWANLWLGNTSVITWSTAPSTADVTLTHTANTLTFAGGDVVGLGDTTATSYGGITEANLVDKSASETISGQWSFGRFTTFTFGDDTPTVGPFVQFKRSRAASADVQDGDDIGELRFWGKGNGTDQKGASIVARVDGTPGGATDMPSELLFNTSPEASATPITRLTIGSDGVATFTETISGSITGNAGTVTTIAGLAPDTATTQATQASITTTANLVEVGALNAGSITSGFTSIDVGSGAIDGGVITADTNFAGDITGNVTGNVSGSAGTVTGFTPASGSLTLAGADAVTITTTGVTNSTLPLGTKTLVATDVSSLSSLTTVGTLLFTSNDIVLGNDTGHKASIILNDSALADESWSGITEKGTGGATIAVGDVCYLQTSDSRWELVDGILDGTDVGFKLKLGICVLATTDGAATEMLTDGLIASAAFPAFTVGAPVYLDDTAGNLVVTQPTTTNFAIRIVGYAKSATVLRFTPSNNYIVHA